MMRTQFGECRIYQCCEEKLEEIYSEEIDKGKMEFINEETN